MGATTAPGRLSGSIAQLQAADKTRPQPAEGKHAVPFIKVGSKADALVACTHMKLALEDCLVELDSRTITRGEQRKRLTATEVALLRYLADRPHEVVSREELYR